MKTYQCHKRVKALKINLAERNPGTGEITIYRQDGPASPEADGVFYEPAFVLDAETSKRFAGIFDRDKFPEPDGGYYVEYEDGYVSWSPTKAFEEGYSVVE